MSSREIAEVARRLDLLNSVRRIMQAVDIRSRRMGAASQITLPQLLCLMAVVAEEGLTSREIARRVHVSASTLVGVLDRLEAKGLITRVRDARDRRQIHIVPTKRGRSLTAAAPSPLGEDFEQAFSSLPVAHQKELVANVALMADLMGLDDETQGSTLS